MLKILIADDHSIVRQGLKLVLLDEYPFAKIEEVENGNELFNKTNEENWDLIITDITMPIMNGLEALVLIREKWPKLPVLVLSMHSEEKYLIDAIKKGASGYLTKSMAQQELALAARALLNGKKYFPVKLIDKVRQSPKEWDAEKLHLSLSERELEIFHLLASGKTISEIASICKLDSSTVSTYRSRILGKMNFQSNADMTRYIIENGLDHRPS